MDAQLARRGVRRAAPNNAREFIVERRGGYESDHMVHVFRDAHDALAFWWQQNSNHVWHALGGDASQAVARTFATARAADTAAQWRIVRDLEPVLEGVEKTWWIEDAERVAPRQRNRSNTT